jgi:hypothetical protein
MELANQHLYPTLLRVDGTCTLCGMSTTQKDYLLDFYIWDYIANPELRLSHLALSSLGKVHDTNTRSNY